MLNSTPAALAAARAESDAAVNAANADVAARLAALNALTNPGPPTAADIATAEADLATAKANASTTLAAGEEAVDQADSELANARTEVTVQRGALTAAENARSNAEGSLNERTAASELAQQEADLAHRGAGVQVPADEVVFVAVAPVRVSELLVATGDPAIGPVMSVTDSQVFVDSSLAVEDAALVKPGMTVSVDEASLGIATEGVVDFVAPAPGTNGVDGFHIYFQVSIADPPPNLVGASVRLTIPVESTGGAVLAVPLNALTMGPDGSSRVHVDSGGGLEIVGVTPGLSADGYVEITPTGGAGLSEGDLVLIGVDRQTTSSQNAGSRNPIAAGATID